MRKIFKFTVIFAMLFNLTACKPNANVVDKKEMIGNTSGNINNGGMMAEYDGWVYYSIGSSMNETIGDNQDNGFYRMKPNGTQKEKLSDLIFANLNISSDQIIATVGSTKLYRFSLTNRKSEILHQVGDEYSEIDFFTVDNYVYYNPANTTGLYRMKNDGSDSTRLTYDAISNIQYFKKDIYGIALSGGILTRFTELGKNNEQLSKNFGEDYVIANGRIYYESTNDGKLYAMNLDGTEPVKILDAKVSSLNADSHYIFYISPDDHLVHVANFEGTYEKVISSHFASNILIAGGWVYYSDNSYPTIQYHISLSNWIEEVFYAKNEEKMITEVENKGLAISNMNLMNRGLFAKSGDWIYFSSTAIQNLGNGIFKMRVDGSERTRLSFLESSNLVVIQDWIYFLNVRDENKIYRLKSDGSKLEKITDISTMHFTIYDSWIYLTTSEQKIIKMKTNGTESIDIEYTPKNQNAILFGISDNRIYASLQGLTVMDFSGKILTQSKIESSFSIPGIFAKGDWIYYLDYSYSYEKDMPIIKVKTNSTSRTEVVMLQYHDQFYGIDGDWIYFSNKKGNEALVRLNLENDVREVLISGAPMDQTFIFDSTLISIRQIDNIVTNVYIYNLDDKSMISIK